MRLDRSYFSRAVGNQAPVWPFEVNRESPQARGLRFWAPFGGAATSDFVADLSGFGKSLVAVGGPIPLVATPFGTMAAEFNSVSRYYDDSTFVWGGGPTTVCYWQYVPTSGLQSSAFGVGTSASGTSTDRFQCHSPWSDGNIYWDYGGSATGRLSFSYAGFYGRWVHVALTAPGAAGGPAQAIYLDGVLRTSRSSTGDSGSHIGIEIGSWNFTDARLYDNGRKFDFRIYDHVKSAAEVRQLYDPATRWDLYEDAAVPRVWPAAGAVSRTAIFSLDAAVRHQASLSAAASAALRARLALTALSSAALERALLRSADVDVAVQAIVSAQADLDAALTRSLLAGTALDANVTVQGLSQRVAALDGAVRRLKTLSGTLEAALRADKQGGAELDAPLAMAVEHATGLDGVARLGFALSDMILEAALRATPDRAAALDAVIGLVVAAAGSRTFKVAARSGHSVAAPGRRFEIPAGKRRH